MNRRSGKITILLDQMVLRSFRSTWFSTIGLQLRDLAAVTVDYSKSRLCLALLRNCLGCQFKKQSVFKTTYVHMLEESVQLVGDQVQVLHLNIFLKRVIKKNPTATMYQ